MGEWISTNNDLPEPQQDVLMAFWRKENEYKNMTVGFICDIEGNTARWCAYTDESFYTDCDARPTHWMPLPEPPREGCL